MIQTHGFAPERRDNARLQGVFPVRVRAAATAAGQRFETHTLADNIGCGGLYLQLPCALLPGVSLFILTRLPGGARLAARGHVVRKEIKPHGLSGMAVCFSRMRLIPAPTIP
jgi:hypothetical protein